MPSAPAERRKGNSGAFALNATLIRSSLARGIASGGSSGVGQGDGSNSVMNLGVSINPFVGPGNADELARIHMAARHTAVNYVSTIFALYFLGLAVIVVHYMNGSFGAWSWTCTDLVEEFNCFAGKEVARNGKHCESSSFGRASYVL